MRIEESIWRNLQKSSESFKAVNPQLSLTKPKKTIPRGIVGAGNGKRGVMNKTESEFALMLGVRKRNGEILRYEYEGITLRWADMRYTPDFIVISGMAEMFKAEGIDPPKEITEKSYGLGWRQMKLIEIKGSHVWDRDIVRFKGARAYWPEFAFEMWQKTKQGWKRKF